MEHAKNPPVIDALPVLVVQGVPYQVMYTSGTLSRLKQRGVDVDRLIAEKAPWTLELIFQCLAACISYGPRKFTCDELASLIPAWDAQRAASKLFEAFANARGQKRREAPPSTNTEEIQ